ncbi:hypothetical protein SRB5_48120 [Streptomyces sp. RB5]|uniref:Bacterial SCP orthologue domain-containing protein n=1 Tax=Streptomyces smaragdinus TaxID=2585196 RepID=A0A7K0CMD3_9ACTN|nr:sterol carrier family protein [Streptomyces smaragdinus]MQY14640.1 hypothetical protein [Streptomyces smaragdinus]
MPPPKRRPRTYDPARTWAALTAQLTRVREAAARLTPGELAAPSVRGPLARIAAHAGALADALDAPPPRAVRPALDPARWALEAPDAPEPPAGDPLAALDAVAGRLAAHGVPAAGRLVPHALGAMSAGDRAAAGLVAVVVHADDLARATGAGVSLERQALAAAVRVLADALAVKAPGGAVEVRVPPYAVVQCVEGPRHTRGTPPNVVETDPLTWLRLAAGRTAWADAREAAAVRASGERADIGGLLPVLRTGSEEAVKPA